MRLINRIEKLEQKQESFEHLWRDQGETKVQMLARYGLYKLPENAVVIQWAN